MFVPEPLFRDIFKGSRLSFRHVIKLSGSTVQDKFGRRRTIIFGGSIMVTGAILMPFSQLGASFRI